MTTHKTIGNFINGEWSTGSLKTIANINPANEQSLGDVVVSTKAEVEAAIAAAKAAFPAWKKTPAPKRGEILMKAAAEMDRRRDELARAMSMEEGKTIGEASGEIQRAINNITFQGGIARTYGGQTIPSELPSTFLYTTREALGVVALITPWNFPLAIPVWKLAPALLCGNTVVMKPASITPWSAQILAEVFHAAGLPKGVFNVVFGPGSVVGDTLVTHKDVKAISFTGSNEVGTRLYALGAQHMKKVQCEMGGKNAVIVLDDADLELAATATVQGAFGSTGQRCTATSRAIVQESIAKKFVDLVVEKAKQLKVGDGTETGTTMGPSVDKGQFQTVLDYIKIGKEEGAKIALGGNRIGDKGFFCEPTVFIAVKRDMRIAQEEIFGPVLSVLTVKDFDEAIDAANDSPFGLTSALFTNDVNKVFQYNERIETGMTHVNSGTPGGEAQMPFGGMKATGVGARECGPTAIDFFSEWKSVYIDFTGMKRTTNVY